MQTETQTKEKTMADEITLEHGSRAYDNWTKGTATCNGVTYDFQIKHFDEPSEYGIDSGRISRLWMRRRGDAQAVLGYDRGWQRDFTPRGKGAEVRAAYRAIIAKFN